MGWVGGGVWVEFGLGGQVRSDGILVDVGEVGGVIVGVENTTAVVPGLPYVEFALQAEREVPFDLLHCLFEGDFRGGSQQ
jgi:hypothetical protein